MEDHTTRHRTIESGHSWADPKIEKVQHLLSPKGRKEQKAAADWSVFFLLFLSFFPFFFRFFFSQKRKEKKNEVHWRDVTAGDRHRAPPLHGGSSHRLRSVSTLSFLMRKKKKKKKLLPLFFPFFSFLSLFRLPDPFVFDRVSTAVRIGGDSAMTDLKLESIEQIVSNKGLSFLYFFLYLPPPPRRPPTSSFYMLMMSSFCRTHRHIPKKGNFSF